MTSIRILVAAAVAVLGGTGVAQVTTASNPSQPNYNDPAYWETRTEHPAVCASHVGSSEHGSLDDAGTAVTLIEYGATWPGDHWELLVVKSGSVDAGDGNGPGNAVYPHPSAGTAYSGPLNAGGQQGAVSHWIVCTGTDPQPQPTEVSWTATNGDCEDSTGTLTVGYDPNAVEYQGDAPGPYPAGATVTGEFVAKPGFVLAGSGGPHSHTFAVEADASCVYHVSFEKRWDGAVAPDLDGAVLITASSSIGSAACTSDDGDLTCTYTVNGADADDLHVPFGETYAVTEDVPGGWYTVSGTGMGFGGVEGFDPAGLPGELLLDLADDRFCTSDPGAYPPKHLETYCDHVVTNAPAGAAPAPSFVDPTCADRGAAILDPDPADDVTYEIVAGDVAPGQEVTVRAVAGQGVVLAGTTEWSHTFGEVTDDDCVVPGTPGSSITPACGAATLTFTNTVGELDDGFTGAPLDFTYAVDGEQFTVTVAAGATETVELDFDEDSGLHTVAIGAGEPVLVDSNCEPAVATPTAPRFVDPTCATPAAVVDLPIVPGVAYGIDGTPAPGATVTVTASAEPGFVLAGTATWSHSFALLDADECTATTVTTVASGGPTTTAVSGAGRSTTTTVVGSGATATTTSTTTSTTTPTTSTTPTTTVAGRLPSTGSDGTAPLLALGAALIGVGLVLGAAVRRPRPS